MEGITDKSPLGNRILHLANGEGISDFYVTPWEQLTYRKNGELMFDSFVYTPERELDMKPGYEDYAMMIGQTRFRVSRMMTRGRLRWVMRVLPTKIPKPEDIMVPPAAIKAFLEAKNGLFLVCGATGSGKSTTIASLLSARIARKREHVLTFEDPIEYILPTDLASLVSQREIGSDEEDFASSLRAALRQAPDVIVIGEIRDGETAEIALQAAETGHVVVATLHTSTAAQTVQRYLKLVPSERMENAMYSFADSMRMILCQRLLLDGLKGKRFPIHEVLLAYDSVSGMIRRGDFKKLDHELETGITKGMQNFDYSLKQREFEGWRPSAKRPTGFTEHEVQEFLRHCPVIEESELRPSVSLNQRPPAQAGSTSGPAVPTFHQGPAGVPGAAVFSQGQQQEQLQAQHQAQLQAQHQAQLQAQRQAQLQAQHQAQLQAQHQAQLQAQRQAHQGVPPHLPFAPPQATTTVPAASPQTFVPPAIPPVPQWQEFQNPPTR
ncbi:MAG: ATPase, T2SS/T4P/T4SS family [Verrucomicrobiales bacterium]